MIASSGHQESEGNQVCGFAAVLELKGNRPDAALVARMTALLAHRGPDDYGLFSGNNLAFGFRRLAIQDLAPSGHQPMLSADSRHVIVFNGEIYNFIELRAELMSLGHVFRSSGDTEVLLASYRQWGRECLARLNGMWAFLIYDRLERCIFGARDRFGVKPLYWYRDSRRLMFASEIKAIRDSNEVKLSPNWQTIAGFLLEDRLDASQHTFYSDVEQLPAGAAFECDASGHMKTWRYWSLSEIAEASPASADPVESYRDLFEDAVRLRMRSDVPVGVQLSGGLDSTSIISSMARQFGSEARPPDQLHAFCYMAPQFDETPQIEATLEQSRATLVPLESRPDEMWDAIRTHLWHQDEPVHSFTSVVGFKLMELAKSRNVKVLLNGQGADEVLAGYSTYFMNYWLEILRAGRLWATRNAIAEYAAVHRRSQRSLEAEVLRTCVNRTLGAFPGYSALAAIRSRARANSNAWVSRDVKHHWSCVAVERFDDLNGALRHSVETTPLPLYLRVEDRNSMAHGVEVRLPFLDYRLVELAFSLGSRWKIRGPYTKVLLRDAMHGRIPEIVRTQVRKLGFPTPVDEWFRTALYEPLRDLLASRVVRESGLWHLPTLAEAVERHRRGESNDGARLFDVAQVCLWMDGTKTWPGMPVGCTAPALD